MPSKPVASPPPQPKKVHGAVRDDDLPIDDYENAWHEQQEEEEEEYREQNDIAFKAPNVAAARRMNTGTAPNPVEGTRKGTTGSVNRSKTTH
ncbi:uncharacterized protein AKAW2_20469A [Aspergillus luchuensis]|uniref:Uncharacterized protein n=4 Tax=Aspergillus subgen. Circumdati TaxID=2720871 RepID=A0A146FPA3_ASPKA|nr:uncharacterized protein BO83DRAFT_374147 [Aspergillus eucalypticola CBS 122712]XP_025482076.1 hypothetical protein BO87DRAFT_374281 [Aspergillus neoniger CBS 115656]XP_025558484.1 hypothetical protein BO88DRAFT_408343 [Aspergillus vadensis CBS 113365]XP_035356241.1 C6 finger domain protein [Aspergillus tubingensis]XP_041539295.1 uncharacterized protein AKAW2_20469A [Aspergillus luchuensis]GAA88745.1 hypothetical protein AKAW_06859 [Aspergillus luchuensis IFO 4308]PWY85392.1 hypothetical pr